MDKITGWLFQSSNCKKPYRSVYRSPMRYNTCILGIIRDFRPFLANFWVNLTHFGPLRYLDKPYIGGIASENVRFNDIEPFMVKNCTLCGLGGAFWGLSVISDHFWLIFR